MNFIVIVSDTLRRDHLGCYGNDWISTPNIDSFASRAQVFDRAYSGSFPTVPHRRDLMTGRYTASYTPWAPLGRDEIVLAQVLRDAGYTSMMVCDCPHILENGFNYDRGFDGFEWIRGQETDRWKTQPDLPGHPSDRDTLRMPELMQRCHRRNKADWRLESDRFVARTMAAACEWLEGNYKHDKFFLYVDTFDPHEPWDAPQWYVDMYDPGYAGEVVDYPLYYYTDKFLSPAELKHCRALYAAEVTLVDRWVGRLFDRIRDLGLLDNTAVVFTTDHGFLHGEHGIIGKCLIERTPEKQVVSYIPLYEQINHIPLMVSYPGVRADRKNAVVQPMDLMPTILDIARLDVPDTVDGKSFAGVLTGGADRFREFAVSSPYLGAGSVPVTVVQDKWAAALYATNETGPGVTDRAVDGIEKEQRADRDALDMLFDLSESPGQEESVAENHPQLLSELRGRLVDFLKEIGASEGIVNQWA